ncbi:MAG: hypothetical protein ACM3Q2_16125 [Syntrophothermus sp.]
MTEHSESPFFLSKWYADLTDAFGNLFIVYIGYIKYGRLNISYSSFLRQTADGKSREAYSLKKYEQPRITADSFFWKSDELGLEMIYFQDGTSAKKDIYTSPEGCIKWHCLQTRSKCEITAGTKETFKGTGYVEKVEMTLKPWKLPFNCLRWGRLITDTNSVIWIDYKGSNSLSLMLMDESEYRDAVFGEEKISFNGGNDMIVFSNPSDIKNGEIISSTFSKIPLINKIIPPGLLKIHEHKMAAEGELFCRQNKTGRGRAIYEVVRWL